MTWHLDEELVAGYADGQLVGARAASVEAHLLGCADCRALLVPAAPHERLADVWAGIEERVDTPKPLWFERILIALHVPHEDARLLAAAPSLQLSWLVSLSGVLAFAAAATHGGERGVVLFLVLAPLAPLAAVAGAYGRGIDPTYELTRSTPYPIYRLLMLRATTVLLTSLLITSAFALTVSDSWVATAWLLPSLALAGLVLTTSRWVDLPLAAAGVGALYALAVGSVLLSHVNVRTLFDAQVQLLSLVVAVGCLFAVLVPARSRASFRRIS